MMIDLRKILLKNGTLVGVITGLFLGILGGCSSKHPPTIPGPTQAIINSKPTITPKLISKIAPSATNPVFSPTLISTIDSVSKNYNETIAPADDCDLREATLQSDSLSSGTIVFIEMTGNTPEGEYKDYLFALSSQDLEIQPFMDDLEPGILGYFYTSPDGRWLAFRRGRRVDQHFVHDLLVTSIDEQERKTIPWDEEGWAEINGWLNDNQHLLISPLYEDASYAKQDELIILNPFTEFQQRIFPSFSYPDDKFVLYGWRYVGNNVVYDPTLTRVVYLEDDETMVLWDTANEQELWRFTEPELMSSEIPTWSPNGNFFIMVDLIGENDYRIDENDEFQILLVTRNGEIIWRSELYPYYDQWFTSIVFTWSPDERYFSYFWMIPERGKKQTFLVDTTTLDVVDFCIAGYSPIWSPDNQQFIIGEMNSKTSTANKKVYQYYVVDMNKKIRIRFLDVDELIPVAWLTTD